MNPLGSELIFVSGKKDFRRGFAFGLLPQPEIGEDILDPRKQKLLVVRFDNEVVRSAFETLENVLGIGERSQKDDRNFAKAGIVLDELAQRIAVHLRHIDIRDHQGWSSLAEGGQSLAPVPSDRDQIVVPFEHMFELERLSEAVFDNQDLSARRRGISRAHRFYDTKTPTASARTIMRFVCR